MFDYLLRELKKIEKNGIASYKVEVDEDSFVDKECPQNNCLFPFKVHENDWADLFKDEAVYCPFCGHAAKSNSWWTTEQVNTAKKQTVAEVESRIHGALKKGAQSFNRKQKKGFISIQMHVKGSAPHIRRIPLPTKELILQKDKCEQCNARYSYVGTAFFCPCCGDNSVEKSFDTAISKVNKRVTNIPKIVSAFLEANMKDEAEDMKRDIIEDGVSDCVTAFQVYCERAYKEKGGTETLKRNGFQSLDYGDKRWMKLYGKGYSDWLSDWEMNRLNSLFQLRHILEHKQGIVDQDYIEKSGDKRFKSGQRVVVREDDTLTIAKLVVKLKHSIEGHQ